MDQIQVQAKILPQHISILSREALNFIAQLHEKFESRRAALLGLRRQRQEQFDRGIMPKFLPETLDLREGDWRVSSIPSDLLDRRVEITGPVERKMMINALNSGACVYMADFEDSHSPTWEGTLDGQVNLMDAVRKRLSYSSPEGKLYVLGKNTATLVVRPRGWHLVEKHLWVRGVPVSASLFDFGLYFFHNAQDLVQLGTGPYFYLPKLESHLEARLWNDVFLFSQKALGLPVGTIRATVLIETFPAAFEMHEILFELREHSSGLNCGRWDYIFSFIKKLRNHREFVLPDRGKVTMNSPFLKAYSQLLIQTCHRRGIHAMGGMAAQIPIKGNEELNRVAMQKVIEDKQREVELGHDGTWVAHPDLVSVAREVFDRGLRGPHQIDRKRSDWKIQASDLWVVPHGEITVAGLRTNVNVALLYLASWLRGKGCVPLYHLMEDAATAEISRAQIWQWLRHGQIRISELNGVLSEELNHLRESLGAEAFESGKYSLAIRVLKEAIMAPEFVEFITLPAYEYL